MMTPKIVVVVIKLFFILGADLFLFVPAPCHCSHFPLAVIICGIPMLKYLLNNYMEGPGSAARKCSLS